jgi:hypothetical protein
LTDANRYTLNHWTQLICFLDDDHIELDTNPVERAIRTVALGRKIHFCAGSDGGGARWATLCSLIETCKINYVERYAYLKDVLQRMVDGYHSPPRGAGCRGPGRPATTSMVNAALYGRYRFRSALQR